MNRLRGIVLALTAAVLWTSTVSAATPMRKKPGPVDLRGVAAQVSTSGFTLNTSRHGSYTVVTQRATQVVEKGRSGHLRVQAGDHVGVRGFVNGHTIRAITIRIYPVKPKPYELRGTVAAVAGTRVTVTAGGTSQSVGLTGSTTVSVGRTPGSAAQIHVGERVRMRVEQVNGRIQALSVYVYATHQVLRRVRLHGTVRAVAGTRITITGSSPATVTVTAQTSIRLGSSPVGPGAIRVGQTITVSACCQGQTLVATSIRIDKTKIAVHTYDLRGRVTAVAGNRLQINDAGKTTAVAVAAGAPVQIGTASARVGDIRLGDEVSLRVYRSGSGIIAERVRVLASSRQVRRIRGTVAAVGRGTVTVLYRGKRYVAAVGASVLATLDGKRTTLSAIRPGDRVDLEVEGVAAPLRVLRLAATRAAAKAQTVRGTVSQVVSGGVVIVDSSGARHMVKLAPGVRVQMHGQPAPPSALFPGVRARARGSLSKGTLIATSLTIAVSSRTVHGRLVQASPGFLVIQARGSTQMRIDLPPGLTALDGTRRLAPASLAAGVYLLATGWVESTVRLRATALVIEHPSLSLAATVVSVSGGLTVQTTSGDRYRLQLSRASQLVASRSQAILQPADVPVGVRVHVDGAIDSSGRLLVSLMTVRLTSLTLRGQLAANGSSWSVQTADGAYRLRLQPHTPIAQGSRVLALSDIVPGDDATVYGYALARSTVLVRRIDVHRRLVGLDGTVAVLNPDGFVLQSVDGQHRVITTATTIFSGVATALAPGLTVHVSGYLRGDGVILATRVRIAKTG